MKKIEVKLPSKPIEDNRDTTGIKGSTVTMWVTDDEKRAIRTAAARLNLTMSAFVRQLSVNVAEDLNTNGTRPKTTGSN